MSGVSYLPLRLSSGVSSLYAHAGLFPCPAEGLLRWVVEGYIPALEDCVDDGHVSWPNIARWLDTVKMGQVSFLGDSSCWASCRSLVLSSISAEKKQDWLLTYLSDRAEAKRHCTIPCLLQTKLDILHSCGVVILVPIRLACSFYGLSGLIGRYFLRNYMLIIKLLLFS